LVLAKQTVPQQYKATLIFAREALRKDALVELGVEIDGNQSLQTFP
jgi:hypothetical protein